ncbi:hypothetical protein ACSYGW_05225 [Bacillus glycinifermentans]|uniref:hypothetical protein n=1 Tax=Bacillus glycinifermentans TaxID=1664069 RepID=UPI001FF21C36|nr:hypothetical protein [Bacillus glycinifermentans]MEC3606351.1 hypothetical protein [Bacillus glycinifermentans]UOY88309.1 hypothetical protein MW696_20240 [Bacillus glycinifermentans]
MAIIVTVIAAIIVIIGLVVFNVRSASPNRDETVVEDRTEDMEAPEVQREEHRHRLPEGPSEPDDPYAMNDETYRKTLKKLHQPQEQNKLEEKTQMDDMDYRNALKSMQKRKQD